jgi:Concanavalin A-like lectin/glucanases superfamily
LNVNPIGLWARTDNQGWHSGGTGKSTNNWMGWHHVAWTYNSTNNTTKFYFDGIQDYSSTAVSTGPLTSEPLVSLKIGGNENNKYFNGVLDEIKIYSKTLAESEITAEINSSSLCAQWSFDDIMISAYDSSVNGNHGALVKVNSYTAATVGKIGGGIKLDRSNSEYIDCGKDESLNISDEITVSAWVKDAGANSQVISCRDTNGFRFRLNVNPIGLWTRTDNQGWHYGGAGKTTNNWTGWHHVAWTYNSTTNTTKFYFDGVQDYSSTAVSTGPLTSEPLVGVKIGGDENYNYFDGELDELQVYNKEFSANDVLDIFNN